MAIPFNVNQERQNNEAAVRQLLTELLQLIRHLPAMQNSRILNAIPIPRTTTIEVLTPTLANRTSNVRVNFALSAIPLVWQNDLVPTSQNATNVGPQNYPIRSANEANRNVNLSVSVEVRNRSSEQEVVVQPVAGEDRGESRRMLSMLIPMRFGGTIWTAVIIIVGWQLLRRR